MQECGHAYSHRALDSAFPQGSKLRTESDVLTDQGSSSSRFKDNGFESSAYFYNQQKVGTAANRAKYHGSCPGSLRLPDRWHRRFWSLAYALTIYSDFFTRRVRITLATAQTETRLGTTGIKIGDATGQRPHCVGRVHLKHPATRQSLPLHGVFWQLKGNQ